MKNKYYDKKCKCGCGSKIEVRKNHKYDGIPVYITGHHCKGKHLTKEHKIKIGLSNSNPSDETRIKLSNINKGKKLTEEHKRKISENHADFSGKNNPNYGKPKSKESIKKCKKTWEEKIKNGFIGSYKNKTHSNKSKKQMSETRNNLIKNNIIKIYSKDKTYGEIFGEEKAKEIKKEKSKKRIDYIKENGGYSQIGKNEAFILDNLEKDIGYKITRQHHIKNTVYRVDGYIPELNLVIEIDEKYHYNTNDELNKKDKIREQNIINELNCKFLRIKDF